MTPLDVNSKLEIEIREDLRTFLQLRGWLVEITHGNKYQTGIPDLFTAHPKHGWRWIDVKRPRRYSFTKAQRHKWPIWDRFRVGIWILTAANETEYAKLFATPNWRDYWKPHWKTSDDAADLLTALESEHAHHNTRSTESN